MTERKIFDKLLASGMTLCGAAALMGNLYAESGLNPKNLENQYERKLGFTDESYTAAVDTGTYQNFVHDCAGYGLAQWTYWDRKQKLLAFATERGCSIGDLNMQLDFLLYELRTCYPGVWNTLLTAKTLQYASDAVMLQFERPADTSESARANRAAFGQKYFEQFAQGVPETPPALAPETPPMPEQGCSCGCDCDCCNHAAVSAAQRTHTVVPGDTLTSIARMYGTSVQTILERNRETYPSMTADFIKMGWMLKV